MNQPRPTPTRLPPQPTPEPLVLPAGYRDRMTPEVLERWEDEAASGEPVTLAAPCSNNFGPDPLEPVAARVAAAVDLWLSRGGFVQCEEISHGAVISACARDGRGVAFDNRGMPGWHGTTSDPEPWDVVGLVQRFFWAADEQLHHILAVVSDLDGVSAQTKLALQTLLAGAAIHTAAHHQAQALRAEDLEGVEPLDVPGW